MCIPTCKCVIVIIVIIVVVIDIVIIVTYPLVPPNPRTYASDKGPPGIFP